MNRGRLPAWLGASIHQFVYKKHSLFSASQFLSKPVSISLRHLSVANSPLEESLRVTKRTPKSGNMVSDMDITDDEMSQLKAWVRQNINPHTPTTKAARDWIKDTFNKDFSYKTDRYVSQATKDVVREMAEETLAVSHIYSLPPTNAPSNPILPESRRLNHQAPRLRHAPKLPPRQRGPLPRPRGRG